MKRKVTHHLILPEDLIREILLKLPVKSLLRFKCVRKSWLSLISDPQFAKSHYDVAGAPTHRLFLKSSERSIHRLFLKCSERSTDPPEFASIEIEALLDNDSVDVVSNIPIPLSDEGSRVNIVGSCRGFILLTYAATENLDDCFNDFFDFVIWNPATGLRIHRRTNDVCIHRHLCGIGYDSSTDDYVVVILQFPKFRALPEVDCFSLRTNSWSHIEGTVPCSYPYGDDDITLDMIPGLFLNEALHWMVVEHSNDVIIAFDVRERRLSDIPMPHDLAIGRYTIYDLTAMGGCLCLSLLEADFSTSAIWLMREYKVQASWTKLFVLSGDDYPIVSFIPICYTKTGEILGSNGYDKLVRLNDKGERLELYAHGGQISFFLTCMYRESLLSLPVEF